MWCHIGVIAFQASSFVRARGRLGLLAATCGLAVLVLPGVASAFADPSPSPEMSVTFPSERARLVGSQAVVLVKCLGSEASVCNGTLTLTTSGNKHKVPFSVSGGAKQSLTVPLGADAATARRAVAVARTAQAGGIYARSSEVLRFR